MVKKNGKNIQSFGTNAQSSPSKGFDHTKSFQTIHESVDNSEQNAWLKSKFFDKDYMKERLF